MVNRSSIQKYKVRKRPGHWHWPQVWEFLIHMSRAPQEKEGVENAQRTDGEGQDRTGEAAGRGEGEKAEAG